MADSEEHTDLPRGLQLTALDESFQRDNIQHVAFGGGRHLCLGAHLARVEAQEAISGLLARHPVLKHGDRGSIHHAIPAFRGMKELWVKTGG